MVPCASSIGLFGSSFTTISPTPGRRPPSRPLLRAAIARYPKSKRHSRDSLETAWELGKLWYEDRLSLEWSPKTPETMEAIFEKVGLTGEFWSVS